MNAMLVMKCFINVDTRRKCHWIPCLSCKYTVWRISAETVLENCVSCIMIHEITCITYSKYESIHGVYWFCSTQPLTKKAQMNWYTILESPYHLSTSGDHSNTLIGCYSFWDFRLGVPAPATALSQFTCHQNVGRRVSAITLYLPVYSSSRHMMKYRVSNG